MDSGDGARTSVVFAIGEVEVVLGSLRVLAPDLAVVDALARLQLTAGRLGGRVLLRNPSTALSDLLELVGLAGLLVDRRNPRGAARPPGGQDRRARRLTCRDVAAGSGSGAASEGGQAGVHDVVEPGDPNV